MSEFVIGIDGGGSLTRALIADGTGRELGSAEGAGSAVRPGAADFSADVIASTIKQALAKASVSGRARCAVIGVAGVGRADEREALTDALDDMGIADQVVVMPDALIALEDAFGERAGVLLIAGTGSVAFARGPTGTISRCGGWGPVCGDEGGGGWIGRRALGVVTASNDGREPETDLTAPLLTAAGVNQIEELIGWANRATPSDLARLAPVVMEVAATGDLRASSLITLAVEELGLHVRTLARQLFADERAAFSLALSGGLLKRGTLMRKRLEHRLKSLTPGAQIHTEEVVGARGAVKHALRQMRA
jgi:N-acetylglucosamine kinase-like BadF-type ATPase